MQAATFSRSVQYVRTRKSYIIEECAIICSIGSVMEVRINDVMWSYFSSITMMTSEDVCAIICFKKSAAPQKKLHKHTTTAAVADDEK